MTIDCYFDRTSPPAHGEVCEAEPVVESGGSKVDQQCGSRSAVKLSCMSFDTLCSYVLRIAAHVNCDTLAIPQSNGLCTQSGVQKTC